VFLISDSTSPGIQAVSIFKFSMEHTGVKPEPKILQRAYLDTLLGQVAGRMLSRGQGLGDKSALYILHVANEL
jgi:hypothetical protein